MRKILLIVLSVIVVILFGVVYFKGIHIGSTNVLGLNEIKQENQKVKDKNNQLSSKVDTEYPNAVKAVETAEKSLKTTKEEYESQIALSTNPETGYIATTEKYEIEFLWTKLGNHAKDNDVDMKIELTNSSTATGLYKLNFTVTGSYVGITDFIYAIENDSKLGFKIDNFVMTQGTATFSCDEIAINLQSVNSSGAATSTTNSTTNNSNSNSTASTNSTTSTSNTTGTNTTSNSTNSSKTATSTKDAAAGQ